MSLKTVADQNIPFAEAAFRALGEVRLMPGRSVTRDDLRDATVLICRSVTKVGPDLLDGTGVRFVGTATIGTDHVDTDYLADRGIGFASAPGSNANSVSEYVVAALLVLSLRRGVALDGKSLGIVGCGNVGSRVAAKAQAVGLRVLQNDPPLQRATGDGVYVPLDDVFTADYVTLHVPLARGGEEPTYHMADAAFFERMRSDATLINSSRGGVVDSVALAAALDAGTIRDAVLDVWEGEPGIDHALVRRVALGTPHIAGYSHDGKMHGTNMVYQAACRFLGVQPAWDLASVDAPSPKPRIDIRARGRGHEEVLLDAVRELYDIEADDAALRAAGRLPPDQQAGRFDELRKTYPKRRELHHTVADCPDAPPRLMAKLRGIGFRTEPT